MLTEAVQIVPKSPSSDLKLGANRMSNNQTIVAKAVGHALSGKGAHIETQNIFAGLDWKSAGTRPEGGPHSVFELLNHIMYWQDWALKWLDGEKPPLPKHASGSWPKSTGPENDREWEAAIGNFKTGLKELIRWSREADVLAKPGKKSRLEMLHTISSHNSYHAGQVVVVRQILGKWPPPSRGLTW